MTATGGGSAPSIGAVGTSYNHGSFSTGEDGSAVIFVGAIRDQSKRNQWSGFIFLGASGTVYKDQVLTKNLAVESGKTLTIPENTRLTVAEGVTLTNNGTMYDNGIVVNDGVVADNGAIHCKVTKNLSYLTADNGVGYITQGTEYSTRLTATNGRLLPQKIAVSVGGKTLAAGDSTYSYDPVTGTLTIHKAAVTGAITITAAGAIPIDKVDVTITLPFGGLPFDTKAACETEGVEGVRLYWTDSEDNPVSGDARYYPWRYKAHMTMVPKEGYILTVSTKVSVNNEGAEKRSARCRRRHEG